MTVPAVQLPIDVLLDILETAGVLSRMGEHERRTVTVDYIAPRQMRCFPREEENDEIEMYPERPIPVTFNLESAQFGGEIWGCITVNERVIIAPFRWCGYAKLAAMKITRPRDASKPGGW